MLAASNHIEDKQSRLIIYLLAIFFSLLLSYGSSLRGSVINPDGICYLQSAQLLATSNLKSAMSLCGQAQWPFYSIIIYVIARITHFSYVSAAFIVNGCFSLISVLSFMYLVQLSTQSIRVLGIAATVILLSSEFNNVREYVIRDHGFWAFYLVSAIFFNKFYQSFKLKHAVGWSLTLVLAILFRIEGSIFLLLLPFSILFYKPLLFSQRVLNFFKLQALSSLILLSLIAYILTHQNHAALMRLNEVQYQIMHGIQNLISNFQSHSQALAHSVLSVYSARESNTVLSLLLISWFIYSIIANVSGIYAGLIVYAWMQKSIKLDRAKVWMLCSYIFVNLIITSIFLTENLFLSKRYLIALTLMLMVWVPFALDDLWIKKLKYRWIFPGIILLVILSSLGGIFDFGYSKLYIKHSGEWLAEHAPLTANIYSNDLQVMYFAQHFGKDIFTKSVALNQLKTLANDGWKQYDFLAIHVHAKDKATLEEIMNEIPLSPAHVYANKRGDQVLLYQVKEV